jgi:hypothetical protein
MAVGQAWDIPSGLMSRVSRWSSGAIVFFFPFVVFYSFLSFLRFILLAFLWSSRAPAFYTFALTPQWHSSFLRAGSLKSTSLCVPVATFYHNSSLLSRSSFHSNKTPLTTSTPRLAALRNGQIHLARTRSLCLDHGLRL